MRAYFACLFPLIILSNTAFAAEFGCEGDEIIQRGNSRSLSEINDLATRGDGHAQAWLGAAYLSGHLPKDINKAIALLKSSASSGDAEGQYLLGEYYEANGKSEDDFRKAFELLSASASKNCAPAKFGLGLLYEHGKGTDLNIEEAFRLYREAASSGYIPAQLWLGASLLAREDGSSNKEGFSIIKKASDTGNSKAQVLLASAYLEGKGVEKNPSEALSLLETVFRKNDDEKANAAYSIGWIYMEGKGVPVDYAKAFPWITSAANYGAYDAKDRLKTLLDKLPQIKIRRGSAIYFDWPKSNANESTCSDKECLTLHDDEPAILISKINNYAEVFLPKHALIGFVRPACIFD